MLEIGVLHGASILLWAQYFSNANFILGVDIDLSRINKKILHELKSYKNIYMTKIDAYNHESIYKIKRFNFDIIIDDGSHNVDNQIFFVNNYSKLLKKDGILILEDIRPENLDRILREAKIKTEVVNLTKIKNREDDTLIFHINKKDQLRSFLF